MQTKRISIKWKIFLYLIGFCCLLLLILWLFQTVLLEQFYKSVKLREIEEEAAVIDMLGRVNACRGEDGPELRQLDAELAGREFAIPELLRNRHSTRYMVG